MLNQETKRNIDNARDVLVGKIPVPSQQIEQITIALIYKFTSDIDREDKELGGKGFFNGEFEKYSWSNVVDRKLGGQERLNLYSEGLDKLDTNPDLPQMFRDIFKNAYLPFKDPATLDMFLKEINKFTYGHSEDLGDAFEYLLSTAGSQGDAGQFRTPRHIIDFIVSVVQPQLTDTVLDPACGTAGFLISAYKYIMAKNGKDQPGDQLTIEQKKQLTQNFNGYDITPEMVKLSLVNMYLHNFGNPKIFEYDTLSREERRDDRFDCILANPPFMTPKGGIQPHHRFSIKASKSEVLFVDYIMEHLNPNGKAGIVVPEGIIFQGANAYKSLREKMINENYLRGVISLPAGVFQPYSGVKTSILLLDKELAKKTDKILFVKVENDGFSLGAQRKEIKENDLPESLQLLLQYKQDLIAGNDPRIENNKKILWIEKEKIKENSEYNLSMDRYREGESFGDCEYEMVKLGDVCDIKNGYAFESSKYTDSGYQVMRITNVQKGFIDCKDPKYYPTEMVEDTLSDFILNREDLLISLTGNVGRVGLIQSEQLPAVLNQRVAKIIPIKEKVCKKFLYHLMNSDRFENDCMNIAGGIAQKNLGTNSLKEYEIPLPPLEVQEKIVAELDGYKKIIDGAKMIVENYKPTIKIDPEWEMVKLGDVATFSQGVQVDLELQLTECEDGYVRFWRIIDFTQNIVGDDRYIKFPGEKYCINEDDVVMVRYGATAGFIGTGKKGALANNLFKIEPNNKFLKKFIYYYLKDTRVQHTIFQMAGGGAMQALSFGIMKGIEIPLLPLEEQNQIVTEIEKEEAMVESAKQLIEVFEKKIKDRIDEIWGK